MKSLKAVTAGSLFIILMILLLQLAFIFMAVAYNSLAKEFVFLNNLSGVFRYLIGLPVLLLVMFWGGYITAVIADINNLLHNVLLCLVTGLITAGGMLLLALQNADLSLTGFLALVFALVGTVAGGIYWQRGYAQADMP